MKQISSSGDPAPSSSTSIGAAGNVLGGGGGRVARVWGPVIDIPRASAALWWGRARAVRFSGGRSSGPATAGCSELLIWAALPPGGRPQCHICSGAPPTDLAVRFSHTHALGGNLPRGSRAGCPD